MTPSLRSFRVVLNGLGNSFAPGEIVAGKVVVDLERRKNIKEYKRYLFCGSVTQPLVHSSNQADKDWLLLQGFFSTSVADKLGNSLRVRFKGAARVQWTESWGIGEDSNDEWYTANEEYFRMEYYILGRPGNSENVNIETGYHEYPFKFFLPQNIPSSFECNDGGVRYTIKAVMDRPRKVNHRAIVSLAIETPYYLTECQSEMDTIDDEEVRSFCFFPCMNMGSTRVRIHVPTVVFAIGEPIESRISIENNSRSVVVTKVKLQLEQKVTLYSRFRTSKKNRPNHVVQKRNYVGPFPKKLQIPMYMQVPAVPQSNLPHCSIIDVHYCLAFKISVSGCHCAIRKSYPIVIGTRTAPNLQPTQNTYSMPELGENSSHFEPVESNVPSASIAGNPSLSDGISCPKPITNQRLRTAT